MKFKPYVGVAGFMSSDEIMAAIETVPPCSTHSLAIGILTSAKTLHGETNKYPTRYPKVEDIRSIIEPAMQQVVTRDLPVEFIAHYAVGDINDVELELERLAFLVKTAHLDGVQINVPPHWAGSRQMNGAVLSWLQGTCGCSDNVRYGEEMKKTVYTGHVGDPAPSYVVVGNGEYPIQQCTGHLGPSRGEPKCCVNASKCNICKGSKLFECPRNCTCHE